MSKQLDIQSADTMKAKLLDDSVVIQFKRKENDVQWKVPITPIWDMSNFYFRIKPTEEKKNDLDSTDNIPEFLRKPDNRHKPLTDSEIHDRVVNKNWWVKFINDNIYRQLSSFNTLGSNAYCKYEIGKYAYSLSDLRKAYENGDIVERIEYEE